MQETCMYYYNAKKTCYFIFLVNLHVNKLLVIDLVYYNLFTAVFSCNLSKQHLLAVDWLKYVCNSSRINAMQRVNIQYQSTLVLTGVEQFTVCAHYNYNTL